MNLPTSVPPAVPPAVPGAQTRSPQSAPSELVALLSDYRTCEFATMTKSGVPVAWPAVCIVDRDPFRIRLTTSIALPRKAANIRRDGRVALLFSDPTGASTTGLPQVLVQGTAICPEEISTSPAGMESYWAQLAERQPSSRMYASSAVGRAFFDFYYMRLIMTVTPEQVTHLPPLVREERTAARPSRLRGATPAAEVARRLPAYSDGVLATAAPGALPDLRRVRAALDADGAAITLAPVPGDPRPLPTGPANLLFHTFDDKIDKLGQFGVFGTVGRDAAGSAALVPRRVVTPADASTPWELAAIVRRLRGATRDYLEARQLERPRIAWEEYRNLYASGA